MNLLLSRRFLTAIIGLFILAPFSTKAQSIDNVMEAYENYQYNTALKLIKKVWKKKQNDTEVNYMYGKCILKANTDRTKAKKYLELVIGNDVNYKEVNLELGRAYMYTHEFDKAKTALNFFIKNYQAEETKHESNYKPKEIAQLLLKQITTAETLLKTPLNVSFINLGKSVNTKLSDDNPFITQNGQTLYYTSNKKYDADLEEFINNIYFSKFMPENDNSWSKMKSISKEVNDDENEIIVGLSKDEEKIIVNVNWMQDEGDIFITNRNKKKFQELSELETTVNSEDNEASASLTKNNDTLYFCSNRPGGYGGLDIYISVKLPDGTWGKPFNLGPEINTKYNETYPVINFAGNCLQFASDRPESMGGYDIFSSTNNNKQWSKAYNLGYPINNCYDNYIITFSRSKRYGYTSQIRPEGYGETDIYQVVFNDIPAQNVIYTGTIKKGSGSNSQIIDGDITIEAFSLKNHQLFATSKYSAKGKYTFAFPPGEFKLKITGSSFQDYERVIRISYNEPINPLVIKNIIVKSDK